MNNITIIKRNGKEVPFDKEKIIFAIRKAMNSAGGVVVYGQAEEIADEIYNLLYDKGRVVTTIYEVENYVHDILCMKENFSTARAYLGYKEVRTFQKQSSPTDEAITSLISLENKELLEENSNKNPFIISTQRDLIAGEISKDLVRRKILAPNLVQAHDDAVIHIHDMDYMISPSFNCCLINYKDMFDNNTIINKKMVEKPKSFQVACTVLTQIIAQVASNQYGLI